MSSGPTIVIDPTDIVTWEDAVKLWNFARQANIISGSDYAAPSTPEGYQQLLSLVQTWLASHSGGALTWGNSILPKVAQNTNLITAVQATDPANVGTLSGQPLTDIVTTGGIAGSTAATVGSGSYGLVKKAIAVITATSLLATTIFAAQLSEADKEDIESAIDDYTDEDGNVACYIDENGKTYLPTQVIEAIRQKLIEKGAYSTGETTSRYVRLVNSDPVYAVRTSTMEYGFSLNTGSDVRMAISNGGDSNTIRAVFISTNSGCVVNYYDKTISSGSVRTGTISLSNTFTYNNITYYYNASGTFSSSSSIIINNVPFNGLIYGTTPGVDILHHIAYFYGNVFNMNYGFLNSASWSVSSASYPGWNSTYRVNSFTKPIYGVKFYNTEADVAGPFVLFSEEPFSIIRTRTDSVTTINSAYTPYGTSANRYCYLAPSESGDYRADMVSDIDVPLTPVRYNNSDYGFSSIDAHRALSWYAIYNQLHPVGVPGVVVQTGAILPTDTTKTLEEIYPDWAINKKTVKAVTVDDDNNPQNIVDIDFLPATFKDVQGLDADSTQTQAQAQDGTEPTADDIVNALLPAIQEFYEKIKNSPDIPNPTIPAGDSGDTPPAEPPLISANANGLWDIYNPTLADVQSFGAWLWSSNIIDQITRMFASPIDAVIGFHMIYCTPIKGPSKNIVCGYLDSGVASTNTVANQYATIDCGTVTVPEYYGTVLDYTATKLALYLPFIGIVPLSTAVCMGASLQVIYRIDVLTGTCLAQVKVIKQNSDAVMYTFAGNCAVQIPLTATTYTGTVSALIGIANTAISVAMENPGGAIHGVKESIGGMVEGMGTGGVRQSGGMGSNAGALGIRIPYLIITHPAAYDAMSYNKQYGYPLNQTVTLGDMSGYTKVKNIHLAGIPCTDDELEQIESLLKEGVIIN